jgi:hypothetical protein
LVKFPLFGDCNESTGQPAGTGSVNERSNEQEDCHDAFKEKSTRCARAPG